MNDAAAAYEAAAPWEDKWPPILMRAGIVSKTNRRLTTACVQLFGAATGRRGKAPTPGGGSMRLGRIGGGMRKRYAVNTSNKGTARAELAAAMAVYAGRITICQPRPPGGSSN